MKSYGQFCAVAKAAEVFCERWTALIIRDLAVGASRFCDLQRGVPLMSPTLLSKRLKQLQAEGVVERRRAEGGRGWSYHLTPAGEEFAPLVEALGMWGQRWSRRQLEAHEIDLGLLLWALESGARADVFDKVRAIVHVEFTDQPPAKRRWWFINENGRCELCLEDPGFAVDLTVFTTLPDMIAVRRDDVTLSAAFASGRVEVHGDHKAERVLAAWLGLCALAHVTPQRPASALAT